MSKLCWSDKHWTFASYREFILNMLVKVFVRKVDFFFKMEEAISRTTAPILDLELVLIRMHFS